MAMKTPVTPKSTTAGFWFVRSTSHPDSFHRVGTDSRGLFTCECRDYQYRARDCKHIRTVQQGGGIAAAPKRRTLPAGKNWTAVRPTPAPKPQPSQREMADAFGLNLPDEGMPRPSYARPERAGAARDLADGLQV